MGKGGNLFEINVKSSKNVMTEYKNTVTVLLLTK